MNAAWGGVVPPFNYLYPKYTPTETKFGVELPDLAQKPGPMPGRNDYVADDHSIHVVAVLSANQEKEMLSILRSLADHSRRMIPDYGNRVWIHPAMHEEKRLNAFVNEAFQKIRQSSFAKKLIMASASTNSGVAWAFSSYHIDHKRQSISRRKINDDTYIDPKARNRISAFDPDCVDPRFFQYSVGRHRAFPDLFYSLHNEVGFEEIFRMTGTQTEDFSNDRYRNIAKTYLDRLDSVKGFFESEEDLWVRQQRHEGFARRVLASYAFLKESEKQLVAKMEDFINPRKVNMNQSQCASCHAVTGMILNTIHGLKKPSRRCSKVGEPEGCLDDIKIKVSDELLKYADFKYIPIDNMNMRNHGYIGREPAVSIVTQNTAEYFLEVLNRR